MLHRLWPALEEIPGAEAVMAEWRLRLASDFDSVHSLLRPADREAGCYPAISGLPLPYRIVRHGDDDYAGVPPDGRELIRLTRQDLLIHCLDQRKLCKEVAAALVLTPTYASLPDQPMTWRIGEVEAAAGARPAVHLIIPMEYEEICRAAATIIAQTSKLGVLLVPTRRFVRPAFASLLRLNGGHFMALSDALPVRDRERWMVSPDATSALKTFLNSATKATTEEPLSERGQLVLIAMLELDALDSDRRQPTESIAAKALGDNADPNALKGVMSDLKTRDLINSKTGRGGECWLTESGYQCAAVASLINGP